MHRKTLLNIHNVYCIVCIDLLCPGQSTDYGVHWKQGYCLVANWSTDYTSMSSEYVVQSEFPKGWNHCQKQKI